MSKIEPILWGPKILGRERLNERCWSYAVEAPFDMPADIPDLVGIRASFGGELVEIRGIVPKMPPAPIAEGELIELLVILSPSALPAAIAMS